MLTLMAAFVLSHNPEIAAVEALVYDKCKIEFKEPKARIKAQFYGPLIVQVSHRNQLPARLVAAICWHESNFKPRLVSPCGALGLMQVMPEHFKRGERWYRPADNLQAGCRVLSEYKHRFGSWSRALTAYCYGPAPVSRGMFRSRYATAVLRTTTKPTTARRSVHPLRLAGRPH